MPKLLLIEFAPVNRFHRAVSYPRFLGFARASSVEARWLRLGVHVAVRYVSGDDGITVEEPSLRRLNAAVSEFAPSHLLFNELPSLQIVSVLRETLRVAKYGVIMSGTDLSRHGLVSVGTDVRSLGRFLGLSDLNVEKMLTDDSLDFGYEPLDDDARTMQPLPHLHLGPECTYNAPFSANPFFAGLDLSMSRRTGGCAFCDRPETRRGASSPSREEIRGQLESLYSTHPPALQRLAIRLVGDPALRAIEDIAAAICELHFEPVDLLFDARADRLVSLEERISSAAELLAGTRHRIHIALVGIENFAREELQRMNKGITPEVNLEAILLLLRLEGAYPETFEFREHGGLSTILFTPWSTLEDVIFNLNVVRACKLEQTCGKLFTSRLRLGPDIPMTEAARRDGLLISQHVDRAFDTAARNLYRTESPWMFRDRRVTPVCQVFVRLASDTPFEDDDLAVSVRHATDQAEQRDQDAMDVAIAVALQGVSSSTEDGQSPVDAQELLNRAERALVDRGGNPRRGESAVEEWMATKGLDGIDDPRVAWVALFVELSRAGVKPVSFMSPLRPDDASKWLEERRLPVARVRRRTTSPAAELFFGIDEGQVERALELAALCESSLDKDIEASAIADMGRVLGYPGCCSDAFAFRETGQTRADHCWLTLARRTSIAGPVSPLMNPCGSLFLSQYVPCSLNCKPSKERVLRELEIVRGSFGDAWAELIESRMSHPWLIFLRGQLTAIELIPDGPVGDRFSFNVGARSSSVEESEPVLRADEVVIEPERLLMMRDGELVGDLSAQAFIWSHERAFQLPFWTRVLAIRDAQLEREAQAARSQPVAEAVAIRKVLEQAIIKIASSGELPEKMTVDPIEPFGAERLLLRLSSGGETVELIVSSARQGGPRLFQLGPFLFSYPANKPIAGAGQLALVKGFVDSLKRVLRDSVTS